MSLEVFQAKTWSAMVGRKLSGGLITPVAVLPPRTQPSSEQIVAPEIIAAWELMVELADSSTSLSSSDDNTSCSDSGSMEQPASPEYNSLPEVKSLRYSPESSHSAENKPASPEFLSDGQNFHRSPETATPPENGSVSPDLSEYLEPKWDLVDQDESLPSEIDTCFISVFAKSSEISPESENATEITPSSPVKDE